MLWEPVDPYEALRERFGFPSVGTAVDWVADVLDQTWGLVASDCDRLVVSSWNGMAWITVDGRRLIAKWSAMPHRFPHLADVARLTTWLASLDIPVAAPVPTGDGRAFVEMPGGRFALTVLPVLDGDLLDIDDPAQVVDAGRMLAAVHDALAAYPDAFDGRRPSGSEQLVHRDFRSANVLHDGTRITAVLDLEEVQHDTRVADLARAAVLLGTRYHRWEATPEDVRRRFVAAYMDVTPLTPEQHRELEQRITADLSAHGWT
jgi:homoserine kinase type II